MLVRTTVNHFRVERGCCRYGLLGVVHAERPFILPCDARLISQFIRLTTAGEDAVRNPPGNMPWGGFRLRVSWQFQDGDAVSH
jgi:hypothetical protein